LSFLFFVFVPDAFSQELVVIANSANTLDSISKDQLRDFFFKKTRNWPDGKPVRFFDQQDNSPVRKVFLRKYLNRSSRQVEQFWIAQKFNTGVSAPTQVNSAILMANLVSRFPGGIGYVEEGTRLPKDVKILPVTE
jgi:ABC-type phosphate transport system substrate-binding protein